jgi:hypothetical protein
MKGKSKIVKNKVQEVKEIKVEQPKDEVKKTTKSPKNVQAKD